MYKDDYARAGIRMLPVVEPDCRSTARQIVLYGIVLIPVSLIPGIVGMSGRIYLVGALLARPLVLVLGRAGGSGTQSVARSWGAGNVGFVFAADLRPHAFGQARSVIQVQNLTHRYGDRVALSNVSFEVKKGEIFGLLGPNGGGKSTLFRILSTMMVPTEGRAILAGHDVVRDPAAVRRHVGVVFQTQSLDKALTVEENLRAQGHLHGLSGAVLRERMASAMERLSISDRRKDLVETLSGGLRRRVEIAKALLHRPEVLLMDEASTGLDPAARRDVSRHVENLRQSEGVTILLTTHILEEADRCDRLLLLHQGNIVADGSPAELRASIGGDVVVLATDDPKRLAAGIAERFCVAASAREDEVRVEIENGHRFIAEVVEAFPGAVNSVGLHKPTLEDVFVRQTGASIE